MRELDELDELLPLALDERGVTDPAAEPEDQLVEEEDEPVLLAGGGVARKLRQAGVEVDVAGGVAAHRPRIAGQQTRDDRAAESTAVRVADRSLARLLVHRGVPGGLQRAPAAAACLAVVERREERDVAELHTRQLGLLEERLVCVHAGEHRVWVGLLHMPDVPAEDRLLHRLRTDHVERHELERPLRQHLIARGDRLRELRDRARCRIALQQQVQHRHEVRLARTEAAVEVGRLALVLTDRGRDEAERVLVGVGELRRHDVVLERRLAVGDTGGKRHDEVALVDGLGDRNEVLEQRHAVGPFALRPRVGAGGRHDRRVSRVIASSASCPSSQPSKYRPGGPPYSASPSGCHW